MENNMSRLEARWRRYEGFGEAHSCPRWAQLLGLPRNTLWRYLQRGLTIEQVVELRGIKYLKK